MKIKEPFSVFSNLIFLIPFYFAVLGESYLHAFLIMLVLIFSTIFHYTKPIGLIWWNNTGHLKLSDKIFLWSDTIFACSLVAFNFFVFWQKSFPNEFWYAISISVFALGFFLFPQKGKYDFSQGVWHILSGIITLLAV